MADLTGRTFDRLTVLRRSDPRWSDTMLAYYDCKCACGNDAPHIRSDSLRNGQSRSCGCLRSDTTRARHAMAREKAHG